MQNKGFTNHAVMGAILLSGVWLAIYLPRLLAAIRLGGWPAGLALTAGLLGIILGPLCLVLVEGDEFLGALGIVAALFGGWLGARIGVGLVVPTTTVESARLWGAALGPILLYGSFHLRIRLAR